MLRRAPRPVNQTGALGEATAQNAAHAVEPFIIRSRRSLAILALLVTLSHALLFGAGAVVLGARPEVDRQVAPAEGLVAWVEGADRYGIEALTLRFEPALAPGMYAALGSTPPFYGVLSVLILFAALIHQWRSVPRTALASLFAVLLALELATVGAAAIVRPAPVESRPELPVTEEWRFSWQPRSAYPSRHALVAAALAGSALITWAPLGLAGSVLALAGSGTALFCGAAHVSVVVVGLALGGAAALAGRLGAGLVPFGTLR
jgi:hypothetical protein